jgi:hypothetical protein
MFYGRHPHRRENFKLYMFYEARIDYVFIRSRWNLVSPTLTLQSRVGDLFAVCTLFLDCRRHGCVIKLLNHVYLVIHCETHIECSVGVSLITVHHQPTD